MKLKGPRSGAEAEPELSRSEAEVEPERSRSGAGAEPQRSRSGAGAEPERGRSGGAAMAERRRSEGGRSAGAAKAERRRSGGGLAERGLQLSNLKFFARRSLSCSALRFSICCCCVRPVVRPGAWPANATRRWSRSCCGLRFYLCWVGVCVRRVFFHAGSCECPCSLGAGL